MWLQRGWNVAYGPTSQCVARSFAKNICIETIAVVVLQTVVVDNKMTKTKLTKLELQIMEALWTRGKVSIREIQEAFPEKDRPAYTTIQTTVYRLEVKKAVRRVKKVGNFHIFEAVVSRDAAQRTLIDDLMALFGGRTQPVMAHLIESGKLTLGDVKEAERLLRKLARKDKSQ
jgi:BlaI family penicillinase repressor